MLSLAESHHCLRSSIRSQSPSVLSTLRLDGWRCRMDATDAQLPISRSDEPARSRTKQARKNKQTRGISGARGGCSRRTQPTATGRPHTAVIRAGGHQPGTRLDRCAHHDIVMFIQAGHQGRQSHIRRARHVWCNSPHRGRVVLRRHHQPRCSLTPRHGRSCGAVCAGSPQQLAHGARSPHRFHTARTRSP